MIELDNVTKSFGNRPVLDGLSFHVAEGECLGLLGRAGSGKSTVLRILVGLAHADAGSVTLGGAPLGPGAKAVRHRMGYQPQQCRLYRNMTAEEYLMFFAGVHGISRPRRRSLATELLEVVGLGARSGDDADRLGPLDQRRLGVARTLVHDPDVLLYDEPMAGLDGDDRGEFGGELSILVEQLVAMGKTVVVTGGRPADVASLCSRIAVIEDGAVSIDGPVGEVYDRANGALRATLPGASIFDTAGTVGSTELPVDVDGTEVRAG